MQAAIRAGYSMVTAEDAGRRLVRFCPVSNAIQEAMDKRSERI